MKPRISMWSALSTAVALTLAQTSFAQTAPAAAPANAPVHTPRVLVIPFSTINVPENEQWVSKGVQESIIADLGRAGGYSPIAFQGAVIVEDNGTAARIARNASADMAVRGAAQVVGGNVRLTAQLIDAKSGDTVSTASVTGSVNDLLKLEDDLSAQLRGVPVASAPATTPAAPIAAAGAQAGVPIVIQQPPAQPPQIIVIQQPPPAVPDYGYGYNYPYWGYPVFYSVNVPNRDHGGGHGHDHDHDRPHGGGNGPAVPAPHNGSPLIPNNNVLPLPTNNVLPLPTNNILPLPTPTPVGKSVPITPAPRGAPQPPPSRSHPGMPSPASKAITSAE